MLCLFEEEIIVTIKGKLTSMAVLLLFLLLLTTAVTNFMASNMLSTAMNREALNDTVSTGRIIKDRIDSAVSVMAQTGGMIGYGIEERRMNKSDVLRMLIITQDSNPESSRDWISALFFGWESDGWFSCTDRVALPHNYDCRVRPWYRAAVRSPSSFILSDPHIDERSGRNVITASRGIYDNRARLIGVIGCNIDIKKIADFMANEPLLGEDGFGTLLAKDGTIMIHPKREFEFKVNAITGKELNESQKAVAAKMLAGETGFMDYDSDLAKNKRGRTFYAPVGNGFFVARFCSVSNITEKTLKIAGILFSSTMIAMIMVLALSFYIARGIANSISDMSRTSAQLVKGDITVRYNEDGDDELAGISAMFNKIITSLSELISKVSSESNSNAVQSEMLTALSQKAQTAMESISNSCSAATESMEKTTLNLDKARISMKRVASDADVCAQSVDDVSRIVSEMVKTNQAAVKSAYEMIAGADRLNDLSGEGTKWVLEIERCADIMSEYLETAKNITDNAYSIVYSAKLLSEKLNDESAKKELILIAEESLVLAHEAGTTGMGMVKLYNSLKEHLSLLPGAAWEAASLAAAGSVLANAIQENISASLSVSLKLNDAIQIAAPYAAEHAALSHEMSELITRIYREAEGIKEEANGICASSDEAARAAGTISQTIQKLALTSRKLQKLVQVFKI